MGSVYSFVTMLVVLLFSIMALSSTAQAAQCTAVSSLVSGSFSAHLIQANGSFTASCNYGSTAAGTNAVWISFGSGASCNFQAWSGGAAQFSCVAGAKAGSFPGECQLVNVSPMYFCARKDAIGTLAVAPTLVNPVSPLSYGAKCDGVTDDTAAFQSAVIASDVMVTAGRTCVINGRVSITSSNRHIQCGAGATLKQTIIGPSMFVYSAPAEGGRLSGDSIVNCYFLGTNTVAPQADWNNNAKHWNIPVETQDRVDHFFLAGNTFDRFWGQAMFQTYGSSDGGTGTQVIYNTFKSCAYYGVAFDAHTNGLIAHNTLIDCAIGVENDDPSQNTGGNVLEYNDISCIYGYGAPDMDSCAMITGGVAAGANYTGNIVRFNSVSGVSNAGIPSRVIEGSAWVGVLPAQYQSNSCTNGCVVNP